MSEPTTSNSAPRTPEGEEHRLMPTRTVAIIKNHALKHRLTIERRILEASFEIIKERPMEFESEGNQDFLYELFGEDTDSLFEGPVWVYVLERRRAVEVWNSLMGDRDPVVAREISPTSLRAIYGVSIAENAFIGSPDAVIAEEQISALFVSSPPFPTVGLSNDEYDSGDHTIGDHRMAAYMQPGQEDLLGVSTGEDVQSPSSSLQDKSRSQEGSVTSGAVDPNRRKTMFKARPLPATTAVPSIQPRTTRAAALRAGLPVEPTKTIAKGPRTAPTREQQKKTFMDVPGHKRSSTIQVASTAPPTIAPRMSRAASLRISKPLEPPPGRLAAKPPPRPIKEKVDRSNTFEGVPGHKRRETITVASVKPPTVMPRINRSATLRALKDQAPPSAFRAPSYTTGSGSYSRPPSQNSVGSSRPPSSAARRPVSALASGTSQTSIISSDSNVPSRPATVRPSSVTRRPSIVPRTNKSALLRATGGTNGVDQTPAKPKNGLASQVKNTLGRSAPIAKANVRPMFV